MKRHLDGSEAGLIKKCHVLKDVACLITVEVMVTVGGNYCGSS